MSVGKFVVGFVVGSVVGSVIGVLLAPQSGEETDDMVSEVQKKGEEIIDRIQGLINKQKEAQN